MTVTPYPLYENQKQLPENYWEEKNEEGYNTYVWQFKFPHDGYTTYHKVDFDGMPLNEISPVFLRFELVKVKLFDILKYIENKDEYDKGLKRNIWWIDILNYYFFNTLAHSQIEKEDGLDFQEFSSIIAPKETVNEIEKIIKEHNLTEFNDFIFFLIAKIQDVYIDEIEYYQKKKKQKEVKKFPKECETLIRIVEKYNEKDKIFPDPTNKSKKPTWCYYDKTNKTYVKCQKGSTLEKITFHFDNEKSPLSITDGLLLADIMEGTVHRITSDWEGKIIHPSDEENYLKWRKHIRSLPDILNNSLRKKNQFKKDIAKALHKFLSEQTPLQQINRSAIFIGKIFSFTYLVESEKEFTETILPTSSTYQVGSKSKITAYEKFLCQNIKDYISRAK